MSNLKQGQRVHFECGDIIGDGKIVGKAMNNQPIIGRTYIIEPDEPIENEEYNYTHFALPEIYFELI